MSLIALGSRTQIVNVTAPEGVVQIDRSRDLRMGDKTDDIRKGSFNRLFLVRPLDGPQDIFATIDTSITVQSKHKPSAKKKINIHRTILRIFVSEFDGETFGQ